MNLAKIVKIIIGIAFFCNFCIFLFVFAIAFSNSEISNQTGISTQKVLSRITRLPGQKYCTNFNSSSSLENITNARVNAIVNNDGSIDVDEQISMDFPEPSHGIERYIDLLVEARFDNGQFYVTEGNITNLKVTRGGISEQYTSKVQTASDNICTISGVSTSQKYLYIKIGSPYNLLSVGNYTYNISYKINNGLIRNPDGNPYLYINLWGAKWNANIQNFSAQVTFPNSAGISKAYCYKGRYGENSSNLGCNISNFGNIYNYSASNLKPFEAVTVTGEFQNYNLTNITSNIGPEIKVDNNLIATQNVIRLLIDILIIIVTFLLPVATSYLIYKFSHTTSENKIIYPIYTPIEKISAAQSGMLVDSFVNEADLASIIISLCVKGWMKLKEDDQFFGISKSYTFINNPVESRKNNELSFEEKIVYDKIFENGRNEIKQRDLGYGFATTYQSLKSKLYAWGIQEKYLTQDPELSFQKVGLGAVIILVIILNYFTSTIISLILIPISIILSILIFRKISVFTKSGREIQQKILGFKMYLGTAEKNKIEFLDDPNTHNSETFEKYLPYAMSLGVTKIWTDKFQDVFVAQPDWYVGGNYTSFNNGIYFFNASNFANSFSNSLNNLSTSINTTYSNSGGRGFGGGSWGGGGFSGGGGFGGGGGRW